MSAKNFMSYGDAETVFTAMANAIKNNEDAVAAVTSAITAIKDGSELDSFGDVEVALLDKADTSDLGTAAAKDSTNSVTAGSTDLVESGAVKDAIDAAVASAYHHAGTKTVAQLTHDLLIAANEGNVYNITDSGTTTSDFIEGIGKQIDAGDNVGICKVGNVYMFDLLSGLEDTSLFVQKSQTSGLLKNDGTVNTTIEDTVAGHTTALAGKQDTLTFDDTPTDGSNNPVKSNGIYDSEKDIYAAMGEMGAKNLIPYPYYESNHTESGITWTVNSDGSVTANGTATADSTFALRYRTEQIKFVEKNTSYILSGCPSGGSNSKYHVRLFVKNQDDSNIVSGTDYGDGATIDMPDQDYYGIYAFARVISGQTVSDLTFEPMLRLASDTDNTYQPYAKTNKQLTDDVALLESGKANTDMVAADFNAGTSYTAGNYCIYEGKFYKFKNDHSGAWSAADVDEIKIAGELSALKSGLTNQTARSRSNITSRLTNLATAVAEQNLEKYGYKIGDYFTGASGYIYHLADMDTFYGGYNNKAIVNTHHISLVVKTGANSEWAETDDTSGGYKTSTLHSFLSSTVLDNIKSDMIALFGGSTGLEHLVSHKLLWTTATSGAWAWSDNAEYISALSEPQVYGTNVWAIDGYQTGEAWKWLEIFHKFNFCEILGNIWWWLRSISSASDACYALHDGYADYSLASDSGGAVGLIIFH